jgi:hypothetical protein
MIQPRQTAKLLVCVAGFEFLEFSSWMSEGGLPIMVQNKNVLGVLLNPNGVSERFSLLGYVC